MELLRIEALTVRFGQVTALHEVSFAVPEGQRAGILGPNGAGKTTLLRAVLNRDRRAGGRIWFGGEEVTGRSTPELVRAGISLCPENRRLFPSMTIEENLLLGAHDVSGAAARQRLQPVYDRFSWIARRRKELAGRLSGGEQQAVTIGRALAAAPRLLMLDEPSSGLSPVAINQVGDFIASVAEAGTTVLLVEQNVTLVERLCTHAWVLGRGQVRDHGPVADLLSGVRVADVYLGAADIDEQVREQASPGFNATG